MNTVCGPAGRKGRALLRREKMLGGTGPADVRVYPRLRAAHSRAAELVEGGELKLPAAIVASLQTAGRGRGSNAWYSDAGSLTATFVFAGDLSRPPHELPLRAGLACRRVIAKYVSPERVQVKW